MRGTTVPPGTPAEPAADGGVPVHRLEVAGPLPFAVGTFDSIGPLSRAGFPHRHTFHEIVFVTAGRGAHVVDLARTELRPPHLGVIAPGQVHHWDAADLAGHVVLFTDDFLLDHPGDAALLRGLAGQPWTTLDEPARRATAGIVAELHREAADRADGADGADTVLRALVHVLVVRAARLAPPAPTGGGVAAEFARLRDREPLWSVTDYAERIGVTPAHLARAVTAATGRSAAALVRESRVHEAKRLLATTALAVRQVAARVGFADPAYFCRFFRRETGLSPGAFRRGNGNPGYHHDPRG